MEYFFTLDKKDHANCCVGCHHNTSSLCNKIESTWIGSLERCDSWECDSKKAKENMEKAEEKRVFEKCWDTNGIYEVVNGEDGLARIIKSPNGDYFDFGSDLKVDYFYTDHMPMIDKIIEKIQSLVLEAQSID